MTSHYGRKYSKESQDEVRHEMDRYKHGKAYSGPKRKPIESREQAIAIGLSKARAKGAKVPEKPRTEHSKKSTTTRRK